MSSPDGNKKRRFLFVIGCPGAGKGTLCKQLARDHGFHHVSVGDALRERVETWPSIASHVRNSELLPNQYLIPLLRAVFDQVPAGCPIILDGFPRCESQIGEFENAFGAPRLVLFFQCRGDVAKKRVIERRDGREGDNSEMFDKRYKEYLERNPAVLDYYGSIKGQDRLLEIDTSTDLDASYPMLLEALGTRTEWLELISHSPTSGSTGSS